MKRSFFHFLLILFVLGGSVACTKETGDARTAENPGNSCRFSSAYNADFLQIDANSSYDDLFGIFLAKGDNYQTLVTNSDTIAYYRWYDCSDSAYFIEVDLEGGKPRMAMKTITDTICASNVNQTAYDSLTTGMSFPKVRQKLGGAGDNFRNDYEIPGNYYLKRAYYRFTDCSDTSVHIEVQISPVSGLTTATKSF